VEVEEIVWKWNEERRSQVPTLWGVKRETESRTRVIGNWDVNAI